MNHLRSLFVLTLLTGTVACQDSGTAPRPDLPTSDALMEGYPAPGPLRTGWIRGHDGQPMEITYELHEGHAIWQGDIDLGPAKWIPTTRQQAELGKRTDGIRLGLAIDGTHLRWPGGRVPYLIPAGFPDPGRITQAIEHIEARTVGVDFVKHTGELDHVKFVVSTGCSATVGRVGGAQNVRLADGCTLGNTIHELLHTLGMRHEQARCDRDDFVTIQWDNVEPQKEHNFSKRCDGHTDYGAYFEGSIMHYGARAFSRNGEPTIVSKRGLNAEMGQRNGMSASDIATVDTLYPVPVDDDEEDDPHDQGGS
ncbi:MAG TPA: M12 family metallopeptidase [Longimicrobium sp.]|nr:M12 family metallopeptidase [Longimicrobium sp.]